MKHYCLINKAAKFLGTKWTLEMVYYLQERRRFCDLQDLVGGVNPTTLSQRLKMLENEEMIQREAAVDSPHYFEYKLTNKRQNLLDSLEPLADSIAHWYPDEAL